MKRNKQKERKVKMEKLQKATESFLKYCKDNKIKINLLKDIDMITCLDLPDITVSEFEPITIKVCNGLHSPEQMETVISKYQSNKHLSETIKDMFKFLGVMFKVIMDNMQKGKKIKPYTVIMYVMLKDKNMGLIWTSEFCLNPKGINTKKWFYLDDK